jgi:hypothetical protein
MIDLIEAMTAITRMHVNRAARSAAVFFALLFSFEANARPYTLQDLHGRIVANGIAGAGAISAVGVFHSGGPIHDIAAFQRVTEPGAILDPERIFVASTSNFGAPQASTLPTGSVLSIDPRTIRPFTVPLDFAAGGGQSGAVNGHVRLFSANSPPFANRVHNPSAITAGFPPLSNPTGISLNNAFGRIWVTSMPSGPDGKGLHSILDPDGCPLANAPDRTAGGVFTGTLTNRQAQLVPGDLASAVLATALLGRSPDGSGRAVFASLQANGSIAQIHAAQGVDGLAPPATLTPRVTQTASLRAGMLLNWVPNPTLYVSDPVANVIVKLVLRADANVFRVENTARLTSSTFDQPVDLAPVFMEQVSSIFSSNTTLAGGSDLYVLNRGNSTIVRLSQDGSVVAIGRVTLRGGMPIGGGHLNGIATSMDGQKIWVTANDLPPRYSNGAVIELAAFGNLMPSER